MAIAKVYNPNTGQYEEDPTQVQNPNNVGTGTGVAAPAAPQYKDYGSTNDGKWLGWLHDTYGPSASRGGAFSDLPSGTNLSSVVDRFNQATGSNAKYLGGASGDQVDFGQGGKDVLTSGGQLWYDYGAGGPPGGNLPEANGAGGGGVGGAAAGSASGTGADPATAAYQQQIRAMLLQQMQGLSKPVDMNDPAIAGSNQAYRVVRERAAQQERAALAERAAAEGLNSGGQGSGSFDSGIQGIQEQAGQDMAGHDANAVLQETQQRRASLQNLLQMALNTGDAESARNVQLQISQMDNEIRKQTLAQQGSQFDSTFGAGRADAYGNDQYRNALLLAMGGG